VSNIITIVGGGLAGLTLGILLRKQNHRVTIYEAGNYPRHRVCGEFLNGAGAVLLQQIMAQATTPVPVTGSGAAVAFFNSNRRLIKVQLPNPGLIISRWDFDAFLAAEFQALGGELLSGVRWRGNEGSEGIVFATGRTIDRSEKGFRFLGIKVHLKLQMDLDLEMHFRKNGYVGLTKLPGGFANLCGLFKFDRPVPGLKAGYRSFLAGETGSVLWNRLRDAAWLEESFWFCVRFSFGSGSVWANRLSLGDSFEMIPPFTGNGMSLALEMAFATEPWITRFAEGKISWTEVVRQANRDLVRLTRWRMISARLIQTFLLRASERPMLFRFLEIPGVWRRLYGLTR